MLADAVLIALNKNGFAIARSFRPRRGTGRSHDRPCRPRIADNDAMLVNHHPGRLQHRKCDQADHRGCRDQERIADLPAEQNGERDHPDQGGQPVADRDASEQDTGAEDGSDRCRVRAFDESLDIGIAAMAGQQRRGDQHQQERRQENADGRDQGAPESRDQIADKGRGDHNGSGADHADRDGDQELALIEPAELLDQSLLEERHDHEAAAEGERAALRKNSRSLPRIEPDADGRELGQHRRHG